MTKVFNRHIELNKRRELRRRSNKAESLVWSVVRKNQLLGYRFKRQFSVESFVLDFYCAELKLAIEIDGMSHDGEEAKKRDYERQKIIEQYDIKFLRFANEEVYNRLDEVRNKIIEEIKVVEG